MSIIIPENDTISRERRKKKKGPEKHERHEGDKKVGEEYPGFLERKIGLAPKTQLFRIRRKLLRGARCALRGSIFKDIFEDFFKELLPVTRNPYPTTSSYSFLMVNQGHAAILILEFKG